MNHLDEDTITELLRLNDAGYVFHRERSDLEFKESFNYAGLAEYLRDFAAFANNKGGYLIFGVGDSPRVPMGLQGRGLEMFKQIDQEVISGAINEIFSPSIEWEQLEVTIGNKIFGVLYTYEAKVKPVIAKRDEGKAQIIKNGEIYYRYAGRTQRIQYAELENIINSRIGQTNAEWMNLMNRIGRVGPANAAILDTERGVIEKNDESVLVIDKDLIGQIKFIREGEFAERKGATTLKLVGNVQPIDQVEVTKVLKKDLIDIYPYSYTEMAAVIKSNIDNIGLNKINQIIKDNNMKSDTRYCAYNFMNKQQERRYKEDGLLPSVVPTLYNDSAIEFITSELAID